MDLLFQPFYYSFFQIFYNRVASTILDHVQSFKCNILMNYRSVLSFILPTFHVADFCLNVCSLDLIQNFFQLLAMEKHFPI